MGALLRNRCLHVLEHRFIYPEDYCLSKYILLKVLSCSRTYQHNAETLSSENVNNEINRPSASYERKILNESKSDTFGTLKRSIEKCKPRVNNVKTQAEKSLERSKSGINGMKFQAEKTKVKRKMKSLQKDEGNIFGNLSEANPIWYPDVNDDPQEFNDQSDDSVMIKNISKRYRCPKVYMSEMKRLVGEKKLKEALDLFVDMKRNFVQPLHHHFTFMIGACGKFGFTEMAFSLFRQMTDRGLKPTPATLTGLFNSCAESPFPEYSLHQARLLKEKIEMKNWELNQITYHSMIKAFGKCGDIQTAFQIVDEMVKADIKIDAVTYNFLLMSCVANKEAGFTYAVEVWRKMKARKCTPNLFSCNLLLRTARDCGVGPEEVSCLLLQHWSSYSKRPYGFITKESVSKEPILCLVSGDSSVNNDKTEHHQNQSTECQAEHPHYQSADYETEQISNESTDYRTDLHDQSTECKTKHLHDHNTEYRAFEKYKTATDETSDTKLKTVSNKNNLELKMPNVFPSLLALRPVNGPEILELSDINTPYDKLSLLGGMEGFLKSLSEYKLKPNIKTFTLLLESLPPKIEYEEKLLTLLDAYKVAPDIGFFNILIKRRNFRKETDSARNVLELITRHGLTPDLITFGVLALGCQTYNQASIFIGEMEKLGFFPNIEIIGALVSNGCQTINFSYIENILKFMQKHEIKPNERMLEKIENFMMEVRESIFNMEHNKEVPKKFQREDLNKEYKKFCAFYEQWLKNTEFEREKHLWSQFRTDIVEKVKKEDVFAFSQ